MLKLEEMEALYTRVCILRSKISGDLNYTLEDVKDMNWLVEMLRFKVLEMGDKSLLADLKGE